MSKMKDHLMQEQSLKYAVEMFKIQGFSPSLIGKKLYLQCWNDDLTEAYHVDISQEVIEFQANEYLTHHA